LFYLAAVAGPDHAGEAEPSPIRTDEVVLAYRNPFITVYDDRVTFADGGHGTFLRIGEGNGHPGVVALAMCSGRIALVKVYRYAIGAWEWGVPRGNPHGADPTQSLLAELTEELGEAPGSTEPLLVIHPNSGLLAGAVHVMLARYAEEISRPRDRREVAAVRWESPAQIAAEIRNGHITDGFTVAAVMAGILHNVFTL
jgi:8-oxo-dGTP pyrophosphatase MutT (NUDIX family)